MTPEVTLECVAPEALDAITQAVIDRIADRILTIPALQLTSQELRIAILLGRRMTLREIAAELNLKHPSDIHTRIRVCCKKNGIDRHDLTLYGTFMAWRSRSLT